MHPRLRNLLLTTAALLALGAAPAAGGPARLQGQGGPAVIVNQSSNSAIINWNTFNIGVNESVRFNQPSTSSVVLNRVTGGLGPSEIRSKASCNGSAKRVPASVNSSERGKRLNNSMPSLD